MAAAIVTLYLANDLPPLTGRTESHTITDTEDTRIGKAVEPLVSLHPGLSGIYPLRDSREAFTSRYLLAQRAERSLDLQYYIWNDDVSGQLMMQAVMEAAGRGVRVRILLDDNTTSGLDEAIAAIDAHPSIEVRLFNPLKIRRPRLLSYVTEFMRLNRRMHNKSFTADNHVTIIGGRNIGDEYFDASETLAYADLDVIAIGPVVADVSKDFDLYWNSEPAYPASLLIARASEVKRFVLPPEAAIYMNAVRESRFDRDFVAGALPFEWATTRMISDPPSKVLGRAARDELLFRQFGEVFGRPSQRVDLVSPYLVPGKAGVELFAGWVREGVAVRVLTNSLAANDVPVVHAGYIKRRASLLESGVELYELRPTAPGPERRASGSLGRSAGAALHAKTFAVDGTRIFIGSFNFDSRSADLNTEMGFVIDSPTMARELSARFEGDIPQMSYELRLTPMKDVEWIERNGNRVIRHQKEPGTGFWTRAGVRLLSLLPIEPLL